MLGLNCALTSADCLGEELAKGRCLTSLQDCVCVHKVTKVTKIVCGVDTKVTFVMEHLIVPARLQAPNSAELGQMMP